MGNKAAIIIHRSIILTVCFIWSSIWQNADNISVNVDPLWALQMVYYCGTYKCLSLMRNCRAFGWGEGLFVCVGGNNGGVWACCISIRPSKTVGIYGNALWPQGERPNSCLFAFERGTRQESSEIHCFQSCLFVCQGHKLSQAGWRMQQCYQENIFQTSLKQVKVD